MMQSKHRKTAGIVVLCAGIILCSIGAWLAFSPKQYSATARIDVVETPDLLDAFMKSHPRTPIYTLCLGGEEIKRIRSDEILEAALKKAGSGRTLRSLRHHLQFHWLNCLVIEITVTARSANETAATANAIAETYKEARARKLKGFAEKELQALKTQLASLTNSASDQYRSLIEKRIAQAERESRDPTNANPYMNVILQHASAPQTPTGPDRLTGKILLGIGFILVFSAFPLVTSARRS